MHHIPVDKEDVDPASANEPVERRCWRGSLRCQICSSPRCVGAEEESRELEPTTTAPLPIRLLGDESSPDEVAIVVRGLDGPGTDCPNSCRSGDAEKASFFNRSSCKVLCFCCKGLIPKGGGVIEEAAEWSKMEELELWWLVGERASEHVPVLFSLPTKGSIGLDGTLEEAANESL